MKFLFGGRAVAVQGPCFCRVASGCTQLPWGDSLLLPLATPPPLFYNWLPCYPAPRHWCFLSFLHTYPEVSTQIPPGGHCYWLAEDLLCASPAREYCVHGHPCFQSCQPAGPGPHWHLCRLFSLLQNTLSGARLALKEDGVCIHGRAVCTRPWAGAGIPLF